MSAEPDELTTEARALALKLWDFHTAPVTQAPCHGDILLVLGSHDLRVADHAGRLWAQGAAPVVVFSGGRGRRTAGAAGHRRWWRTEAEEFAALARVAGGVPASTTHLETHASNTAENFALSRELCAGRGIEVRRAVVTAKPYMARRALATATVHWPGVEWAFRCFGGGFDGYPTGGYSAVELVHFLVGDLQRLEVYGRRGWSAPVRLPTPVWEAYHRLVRLGFTGHTLPDADPPP